MNAEEFAVIFDAEVRSPLIASGFQSSRKSLFLTDAIGCLSLIRLGGRMASTGGISHILCFRHTFLRTCEEVVPRGFVSEVSDYPYKLRMADFESSAEPRYTPQNLGHWDYDRFQFDGVPMATLRKQLRALCSTILGRAVPWALSMSPQRALADIQQFGEDAWIERIWVQDYSRYHSR